MTGAVSVVLHAHLPYIPPGVGPLDTQECWLHEALLECYIPLTLELAALGDLPGTITLSISPTLLAMLADRGLSERFERYLTTHLDALSGTDGAATGFLRQRAQAVRRKWREIDGDLPSSWLELHKIGRLKLSTCAGAHPVVPLLRSTQCRVLHVLAALDEFEARFGHRPSMLWLPECGYSPGVDAILGDAGVCATVVEARALGEASPTALRGKYAPVVSGKVAFFARDPSTSTSVWSATTGYPGHPAYREFHRSLVESPLPLAVKGHRVTGLEVPLNEKRAWEPTTALEQAAHHAQDLVDQVASALATAGSKVPRPHLLAAYDAELFGHWWYEGPTFLGEFVRHAAGRVQLLSPGQFLQTRPTLQVAQPAESSWGHNGDFSWWVDEATKWLIPLLQTAEVRWLEALDSEMESKRLAAATEQLMLAQASDWAFMIRGVAHAEYAKRRLQQHLERFYDVLTREAETPPLQVFTHLEETLRKLRHDRG